MCWHCMGLNINPNSPMKTHLVHVDVGDKDGQLTIIVDINNHFIPCFLEQFPWIQLDFGLKKKYRITEELQNQELKLFSKFANIKYFQQTLL